MKVIFAFLLRHRALKISGRMETQHQAFMTSELGIGDFSAPHPDRFAHRNSPVIQYKFNALKLLLISS